MIWRVKSQSIIKNSAIFSRIILEFSSILYLSYSKCIRSAHKLILLRLISFFRIEVVSARIISGQPLFLIVPFSFGQSSSSSFTPSLSVSGHPLKRFKPGVSSHSSYLSTIPSLSLSGHPELSTEPNSKGQSSS